MKFKLFLSCFLMFLCSVSYADNDDLSQKVNLYANVYDFFDDGNLYVTVANAGNVYANNTADCHSINSSCQSFAGVTATQTTMNSDRKYHHKVVTVVNGKDNSIISYSIQNKGGASRDNVQNCSAASCVQISD